MVLFFFVLATISRTWALSAKCQQQMDEYCALHCFPEIQSRPCDGPMVALESGPSPTEWRCYSPSTLDENHTKYHTGTCYCSRKAELAGVLQSCEAGIVPVYTKDHDHCYRIPSIIQLASGVLLAFAEQRDPGCGDNGENDIVLRRSTDNGNTWGDIILVVKGNGHPFSNPNPVEVTMNNTSRAVLLHFDTQNNPSVSHHGATMQLWSYDEGKTWKDAKDISQYMPQGYAGCMPGPSVGIQAEDGSIYFSCHAPGINGFLYWSEDMGSTYNTSKVYGGLNECSIALLRNQSISMNCRTGGTYRTQITWSSRGKLLRRTNPKGLIDPNCQGSLIMSNGALLLSNDATTTGRNHMSVKRSTDHGETWDAGVLVWAGPSGYSQLVELTTTPTIPDTATVATTTTITATSAGGSSSSIGLLFEYGSVSTYEFIGFTTVKLSN